jgi:plastocyanin
MEVKYTIMDKDNKYLAMNFGDSTTWIENPKYAHNFLSEENAKEWLNRVIKTSKNELFAEEMKQARIIVIKI